MPIDTFLFRLAGPMQSWGTQSRFLVRDTGAEPSKSAIVGLLCAALGKPRDKSPEDRPRLSELAALRLAVRSDREGEVRLDYHTAGGSRSFGDEYGVIRADGRPGGTVVSRRYYLTDAEFLVGIEGERPLLETIAAALIRTQVADFSWTQSLPAVASDRCCPAHRHGTQDGVTESV